MSPRKNCLLPDDQPQTVTQRQSSYHARQLALGRKGRKVYATPAEHERIKKLLKELRDNG